MPKKQILDKGVITVLFLSAMSFSTLFAQPQIIKRELSEEEKEKFEFNDNTGDLIPIWSIWGGLSARTNLVATYGGASYYKPTKFLINAEIGYGFQTDAHFIFKNWRSLRRIADGYRVLIRMKKLMF